MKKTFPLELPGKARPRVIEAVKHDVRRYVQRERRKALPEGFSRWTFQCKAGPDQATARSCTLADLGRAIDEIANAGGASVYLEILAAPGNADGPGTAAAESSADPSPIQ